MLMIPRAPLRVAVLCSHRAPGLVHVLGRDRNRGTLYEVVCCLTSETTFAEAVRVERRGIPILPHSLRAFYALNGREIADRDLRREYDERTVRKLAPFKPDLVVLSGYGYLLTGPMLDEFPGRIVNVHPGDLLDRRPDGRPRYSGPRAVRDAIVAGEPATRASSHLVDSELEGGPVLLRSWPFPVPEVARWATLRQASDVLRAATFAQTEWMLRSVWGPMIARSIEIVAEGGVPEPLELIEDGTMRPLAELTAVG
jgi:folate-dependent phosphoribosylglycinamide formyltransferase PurN